MRNGLAVILVVALAAGTTSLAAEPTSPYIVAHRGLIRHAPENTLANFRACLELRIGFEVDVQRTKDGHLVCIHDDTVDRTTNGTGNVVDLTLTELRTLDAGSWFAPAFRGERIPSLDEVFKTLSRYPHRILVAMDLKAADVEEDVVRLANQHRVLDKLLFIGRTIRVPEVRQRLRKAARAAQIAVVANAQDELAGAIADPNANWVYVRYVPSEADVARIHENGRRVFIAGPTVSGEETKNWRQVAGNGVQAILTDYPLSLARMLRNMP
jgi:glycerophosphoryl diester phosphodiesterase